MKVLLLITLWAISTLADESLSLKKFTVGANKFTASVYKEMKKSQSGSFLVCPLSVNVLLALFHGGAKGNTAKQISQGLNLPNNKANIDKTFTKLTAQLKSTNDYDLTSANKVYLNNGFAISNKYKKNAVKVFDAEIQNLDFAKHQQTADEINQWVEGKTHEKIKKLVSPGDFEENPVSVLINAMYFRGKWVTKFNSDDTKKRDFHVNSNKKIEVEMMELADTFNSYENSNLNAKFLELPYKGDDISMTFILPNDIEGLSRLEANIGDVLAAPAYQSNTQRVIIPKFKMETSIQFVPILKALGIEDPFSNTADFTGFGANKDHLFISKVIQKTFIEVEEEGTTAAAGTAGFIRPLSALRPQVLPFVADHPFIYYIKIKGIIVFVGRYNGP